MGKGDFCKHSNSKLTTSIIACGGSTTAERYASKWEKEHFYVGDPTRRKLARQVHILPCIQNALKRFLNLRILKKGNIRYSSWAINCNLQNKMYKSKRCQIIHLKTNGGGGMSQQVTNQKVTWRSIVISSSERSLSGIS